MTSRHKRKPNERRARTPLGGRPGPRRPGRGPGSVRLHKFLSDAGVASRRHAEELIEQGRVLVNDRVVEALPAFCNPLEDRVVCDGVRVRPQAHTYVLMNKPKGVVCSTRDQAGRPRVYDLLPDLPVRVFPVGRLDVDSTGLLLLTNDGELAERLAHPRYGLPKTYRVEIRGEAPNDLPVRLRRGAHLAEGKAAATQVELLRRSRQRSVLTITVHEGRNRIVRRLLARLGYKVKSLKRVGFGPLELRGLAPGACRLLSRRQIDLLKRAARRAEARVERGRLSKYATAQKRVRGRRTGRPGTGRTKGDRERETAQPHRPRRRVVD